MNIFAAGDVLQFAIGMEENGALFYRQAAELSENSDVKKLFQYLASEEQDHQKTFETLLAKVEVHEPIEDYPGEYMGYLRSYIDGKASSVFFTDDVAELKTIDVSHALDFAMKREMASILYYTELKDFVGKNDQKTVDDIIDEERRHVAQLSETKKLF